MGPLTRYVVIRSDRMGWQVWTGRGWMTVGVPGRYADPQSAIAAGLTACWVAHHALRGERGWFPKLLRPKAGQFTRQVAEKEVEPQERTAARERGRAAIAQAQGVGASRLPDVRRRGLPDDLIDRLAGVGTAERLRQIAHTCGWALSSGRLTMATIRWLRLLEALADRDSTPIPDDTVRGVLIGRRPKGAPRA